MKSTQIQWCHSTVNPVMGCDGCELWPKPNQFVHDIANAVMASIPAGNRAQVYCVVANAIGSRSTSKIYADRESVAQKIVQGLKLDATSKSTCADVIRANCKCYAGLLGTMRSWHKGHAENFDRAEKFQGRMAKAAKWGPPTEDERAAKPWLGDVPRLIFISDMGDALSHAISFAYLRDEIIQNVASFIGQQHIWLWLTKRPGRMADFGLWLVHQGMSWPDNLVAMTTVTSPATAERIEQLRRVPSKAKAISCEPVFANLKLNCTGIDWLIIGGGSDTLASPFHIEWALDMRDQCNQSGTACFLKQLGRTPLFRGKCIKLKDGHGGDWTEWPVAWRTREIPRLFREGRMLD